jgi:nucleotide-binding universal stress UspA family protein
MLPLKRILCPTDLSADSRAALQVAGEMAHYVSAELTVLHVRPQPQPVVWPYEGLGINPCQVGVDWLVFGGLTILYRQTEKRTLVPPDEPHERKLA